MNAYKVAASRSAVGKANRGGFRFTRPDTLAADVIKNLVASVPNADKRPVEAILKVLKMAAMKQGDINN